MIRAGALGLLLLGSSLAVAERDASPETRERLQRWQSLPPEKREQLMERYERFRQLPPEEQEAVKKRYNKWREMPEEDRRAMREKWQQMNPEERKSLRQRLLDEQPEAGGGTSSQDQGGEGRGKKPKWKDRD